MKYHSITILLVMTYVSSLYTATTTTTPATPTTCNGYKELCKRRLNEICWIDTHNGTSYKDCPVQDQDRSLTQQMTDGIGGTKLPIHEDYINPLGYYHQLLVAYIAQETEQRDHILADIQAQLQKPLQDLNDAQAQVNSLQQHINDVSHNIDAKKNWYDHLSLGDQIAQAIPYAAEMGAMEADKVGSQGALATANGVLDLARQAVEKIPTDTDPRVLALNTHIGILNVIRQQIIDKGGPDAFKRTLFACHGLYKSELFQDHISDLLNGAPDWLKPILTPIADDLKKEAPNLIARIVGNQNQAGGVIPFTPCLIDAGATPLADVLKEIKAFLESHPDRIFVLVLEDSTGGKWDQYFNVFQASGILKYARRQRQDMSWPTLGEMISADQRLVIFTSGTPSTKYPWLLSEDFFFPWSNKWDYASPDELINSDAATTIKNPSYRDNSNKFFSIPHDVTPGLAGDKTMAAQVNARSVLRPRALRHMQVVNHILNRISVDFYEHPSTNGIPDVIDVCNEINGVGTYAGKPLWQPAKPATPTQPAQSAAAPKPATTPTKKVIVTTTTTTLGPDVSFPADSKIQVGAGVPRTVVIK